MGELEKLEKENERIEKYLSDFTQKQGVLLAVASLTTLIPVFAMSTNYFLLWIAPFLIIAIIGYVFSSKRLNFVSRSGHLPEVMDPLSINIQLKENYFSIIKYHRVTDCSIISFFVSFLVTTYIFSFTGTSSILISFCITALALMCGLWRYIYISKDDSNNVIGYGSSGPDPNQVS